MKSFLLKVWRGWLFVAEKIGNFQGRVFFTVFYFIIAGPVALIYKAAADPLCMKRRNVSNWHSREEDTGPRTLEAARQQY